MLNFSKKNIARILSLLFIILCFITPSTAKTIAIKKTNSYKEDSTYYLDTVFEFKLTDEANEALIHGIPLEVHTLFQLRVERKWLWDKTVSEKLVVIKLEHMPLTNTYLTININTGLRNSYSNLDTALKEMNNISQMKLFDESILEKNKNYLARIKTFVDIASLPPPLRPQAYFSSDWEISSDWIEWEVIQ